MLIEFHKSRSNHPIFCTNPQFKVEKLFSLPVVFYAPLPFVDEEIQVKLSMFTEQHNRDFQ